MSSNQTTKGMSAMHDDPYIPAPVNEPQPGTDDGEGMIIDGDYIDTVPPPDDTNLDPI
jgi:hypothetical protein